MPKVKILASFSAQEGSYQINQEAEVSDEYAADWIKHGLAEEVASTETPTEKPKTKPKK